MSELRPELSPLPDRIKQLPVARGYPVPWFVTWIDGAPEFRVADRSKWVRAVKERVCWVCGQPLGTFLAFVLGPMCGITRTTSEPACHRECAEWSAVNCPFLTKPAMDRRDGQLPPEAGPPPGRALTRNPGVALVWITRSYSLFRTEGGALIRVGDPIEVGYFREGRRATRQEVLDSMAGGLPSLTDLAQQEGPEAIAELQQQVDAFAFYLPAR